MKDSTKKAFSCMAQPPKMNPDTHSPAHFRTHTATRPFIITIEDLASNERHSYPVNAESPAAALRLILQRGL